ncbi:MAG: serine/threonine-protein kinase, partial [Acidobacteriota bacterium]
MTVSAGNRLGPYEVLAPLGVGGMGEVYRARDTKLNRDVAIKVLPPLFADEPERLARFTREAQVLASLNHPSIGAIFGLDESGGVRALVMELVEGDDLSALIARGPLPLAEVLPIARQIADALEAAHEQGIVHRDLKRANIKVRADGTLKVLDFGLAKAMDAAGPSSTDPAYSPTLTAHATQLGLILGTAAYMSPEQARGKAVDRRADIWAFGVVLYEMLTGRRLFSGEETSDVFAAVLRQEIDLGALPAETPAGIRRLLLRCLDRDVKGRLRDIGEARVAIDDMLSGRTGAASPAAGAPGKAPGAGWPTRLAWLGAGLALGALAIALYSSRGRSATTAASVAE